MLLDSYKGLHLIGGTLSILAVMKLIPSLGKSFAVPSLSSCACWVDEAEEEGILGSQEGEHICCRVS